MILDGTSFAPALALGGGALIGLAVALFALVNGRVAGISGVLGGLLRPSRPDVHWRAAFVAGFIAAPLAYATVAPLPPLAIDAGWPALIVAGLAVGVGTRYASGCTSGHGVCGVARASRRSLVATAAFTLAGAATVYVVRHVATG